MGALPLPVDMIQRALTLQAMDLLDPAPLQVSFAAQANTAEGGTRPLAEQLLLPAGQELGEGQQRQGAVWGHRVAVGQPLQLSMQACCSQLPAPQTV